MANKRSLTDLSRGASWGDDSRSGRTNTLGLDLKGVRALAGRLDAAGAGNPAALKRDFVRWPFYRDRIQMLVEQPGGSTLTLRLACRNLSRGGASLLHNGFLHERSRCIVRLPHPTRGDVYVAGTIVRCTHRGGVVHELGVKFDAPIDARQFVALDAEAEAFSPEKVDPENIEGRLLLVEPSADDRKLMEHFLRRTKVSMATAENCADAVERLKQPVDLIFANFELPDGNGLDLIRAVRQQGVQAPVVLITPDVSRQTRIELRGANCDGVLGKPLTFDRVLRAMAEFLSINRSPSSGDHSSTLSSTSPAKDLVPWFVEELRRTAQRLREAVDRDDADECEMICLMLKGAGPQMGFTGMVAIADRAIQMLHLTRSAKESAAVLKDVMNACDRAKAA